MQSASQSLSKCRSRITSASICILVQVWKNKAATQDEQQVCLPWRVINSHALESHVACVAGKGTSLQMAADACSISTVCQLVTKMTTMYLEYLQQGWKGCLHNGIQRYSLFSISELILASHQPQSVQCTVQSLFILHCMRGTCCIHACAGMLLTCMIYYV